MFFGGILVAVRPGATVRLPFVPGSAFVRPGATSLLPLGSGFAFVCPGAVALRPFTGVFDCAGFTG